MPTAARASTASGRTFDGPQPKRPSAGRRSAGIEIVGSVSDAGHCASMAAVSTRISRRPHLPRIAPSPSRPRWPSTPRPRRCKAAGEDVIGFGAGEPDFPTPDAHRRGRRRGLPRPDEPPLLAGRRPARAARGDRRQDQARLRLRRARPAQVLVTNGGKHAVYNAFAALLDPGDEVLLPAPYWTTYPEAIALAGGVPVVVADRPRRPASGSRVEQLEAARTPRTKALLFVSPSTTRPARCTRRTRSRRSGGGPSSTASGWSPTRSTSTSPTATTSSRRCRRSCPSSPTSASIVNGVAKTYAMTGWRVGWMIGPTDVDQGRDQPAVARHVERRQRRAARPRSPR